MSQTSAQQWLHSPLAIVGMACRLPGADGVDEFWDLLVRGGYAVQRMPDSKLDRQLYFDGRKGQRGKTYSQIGGFVKERSLDWSLLNLKPEQASDWDHCHLSLCEVAARACVDAGYDPHDLPCRKAGVFVGHSGGTTLGGDLAYRTLMTDFLRLLSELPDWDRLGSTALLEQLREQLASSRPKRLEGKPFVDAGFASGLISHNFGLTGPHMSIDAACASSLVALALGAMSLASGQTDLAIIGGASYNKADSLVLFSHAQSCSSQMSRPFDQAADGLISAEGYVTILVKQLYKAQADGDRIHAVIRGIGYSSDGRGRSLWAPRHEGQSTAIQRAYPSDIEPASVQMIEAHATSTQVGDATEMEALASFYAPKLAAGQRLPVGSVKSNIGHTLETAGLAGLVKAVLSMQHGTIPPSINVQNPNETIPWEKIPFYVPHAALPWPQLPAGQPRRAAVNAFGIGGLNVHVVVDQAPLVESIQTNEPSRTSSIVVTKSADEPIALVGRGLVVPGANSLAAYEQLLQQSQSSNRASLCHRVDFEYDWRKHKVPPKQVAHANPLQFMLLEAAEQAINEASLLNERFDRSSAAVVVGSIFGGDFGNSLFAGLRLPEFRDRLLRILASNRIDSKEAQLLADRYEEQFLKNYPALLDETGSFTSSTLASRIAKTFNLMGGAMAIDAGDVSGLAALKTAVWLLQSGTVTSVLCAAAQRALDLAALENLRQIGRLRSDESPSGYAIGEGVALVILKRLSEARRDGNKILATIESVGLGFDATSLADSIRHASNSAGQTRVVSKVIGRLGIDRIDQQVEQVWKDSAARIEKPTNLDSTGHLQGAQGLLDLIACSLDSQHVAQTIVGHTLSGQSAVVHLSKADFVAPVIENRTILTAGEIVAIKDVEAYQSDEALWSKLGLDIRYWSAESIEELKCAPQQATWSPSQSIPGGRFVGVVVAPQGECPSKAKKLSVMIGPKQSLDNLIDQGMWWMDRNSLAAQSPRIALAFSGQGSQYAGMLKSVAQHFSEAAEVMHAADSALSKLDGSTFSKMAWSNENQLGENVWQTQAALLVADSMLARVVQSFGLLPEVVLGHSYGEIPAMLAAGCLNLETALRLTWHRCQSVSKYAPIGCSMLSVQAEAAVVGKLIAEYHLPLTVSHINTPLQTVVGGKHAHVAQLAAILEESGMASRVLPVPTAFHTPVLQPAVEPFRQALHGLEIHPPRVPLLSSVNNRFMADPELIRDGLAEQLVTPLNFVHLMQRLVGQGITHFIEVGPQRVLARLARASASGLQVFASDYGPQGENSALGFMPLALLRAVALLTDRSPRQVASSQRGMSGSIVGQWLANSQQSVAAVKQFDATAARRQRLRNQSSQARHPNSAAQLVPPQTTPTQIPSSQVVSLQPAASPVIQTSSDRTETTSALSTPSFANNPTSSEVEQILIDFVVEQTGYPAEIVELDVDLEADLGIDSIKKAQLLGELRELFPHAIATLQSTSGTASGETYNKARAQGNRLAELRTLRDFVKLLNTRPANEVPTASTPIGIAQSSLATVENTVLPASENSVPKHPPIYTPAQLDFPAKPEMQCATNRGSLEQFVVDFVVEQTGYPAEIVELDADLEADLGIDSIKKAQLLGELRETFSLKLNGGNESATNNPTKAKSNLDQLRTLNQILDLLVAQLGGHDEPTKKTVSVDSLVNDVPTAIDQRSVQYAPTALVAPSEPSIKEQKAQAVTGVQHAVGQSVCALPFLIADHPNGFADAVRLNLRALPSRRTADQKTITDVTVNTTAVRSLAAHTDVAPEAIAAFDQELIRHASWRLAAQSTNSDRPNSTYYFLELLLPTWLTDTVFQPVGAQPNPALPGIDVVTPGATTPLVLINDRNQLLAVVSATAEGRVWLADRLRTLAAHDSATILATARRWDAPCDWSLVLVDPERAMLEEFCSRNQVFSHAQFKFERWSSGETLSGDCWAKLGYDNASKSWVVLTRTGQLHQPIRCFIQSPLDLHRRRDVRSSETKSPVVEPISEADLVPAISFFAQFSAVDLSSTAVEVLPEAGLSLSEVVDSAVDTRWDEHRIEPSCNGLPAVAQRYILRMAPAPQIELTGRQPTWSGNAIVVGNNAIADALVSRLRESGVEVVRLSADGSDAIALAKQFEKLSETQRLPHLFITSACDQSAQFSLEEAAWKARRNAGLMGVFWLCQKWVEHVTSLNMADDASLIAVSSMGGDFGIGGKVYSAEGGGINGLLKSILIESWMQGIRSLPIKTIDVSPQQSPVEVVDCIWHELAIPSYDNEISYREGVRHILKAIPQPVTKKISANELRPLTRGGTWICTGGARGITALVAERLAGRYNLTLHLLGTSPAPNFDSAWRDLNAEGLRLLKLQVMTEARSIGVNPVKHWQNTEKQLEIDVTLERLRSMGITAYYHRCDVSDRKQLAEVMQKIRRLSGAIHGVLHGAGVGRDSRFDRKQPEKVEQCIGAKVDGALALMEATWNDPLEAFLGFGSISGRFGANGHTDYSLANEMLCKQIDWLKAQRRQVRAIGFHWHAWGDVGMATKPETKLALEMIHMQFMPAEEGIQHLINELEGDAGESEVLITDDRYYRAFYPAETIVEAPNEGEIKIATPLLVENLVQNTRTKDRHWRAVVNPVRDPFLAEHLLDGKPLLPFVVASEILYEAAAATLDSSQIILRDIQAHGAIRFFTETEQELSVSSSVSTLQPTSSDVAQASLELRSDFISRKGVIVDRQRLNFSATAQHASETFRGATLLNLPQRIDWQQVHYPAPDSEFYVGWPLQKLRKVALLEGGLLGKISAPALIELAGVTRSTQGWAVPSAALDACLFAVGILAWQRIAPGSALPVRMGQLQLGRLPKPGEACMIHAIMKAAGEASASFDFSLYGVDGSLILDVVDYEVAWLSRAPADASHSAHPEQR